MRYEWWIGARYAGLSRGKKKNKSDRFVSFISTLSMIGIILGVMALIIVLSVMNGFQVKVQDRMLSIFPHIQMTSYTGQDAFDLKDWKTWALSAKENPSIQGVSPYVEGAGMISQNDQLLGVQIRGIDPDYEHEVSELPEQIISDDGVEVLSKKSFNIVIGRQLANHLGLFVGDDVLILAPQGSMSPSGFTPRMKRFKIAGLFDSGLYEYDSSLVFMNDFDAKVFLRGSGRSGIRLKINDMLKAPQVKRELQTQFQDRGVYLTDWTQINKSWFSAVKTEKTMMGLILFLIVAVAAFNLLSSLVMVVKDKQSDIAILRSLGATKSVILRIFMIQGSLIGLLGTSIGLILGTFIAYRMESIFNGIQWLLGIEVLDPSIYLISTLPSQPELSVIALIGVSSFALSFLFTIYPSLRAARLEPAQVLRHD